MAAGRSSGLASSLQETDKMSVFDSMKHAVHTVFKEAVESVTPVSNVSQFRDKGVLTPEEFVAAGTFLHCFSRDWTLSVSCPMPTSASTQRRDDSRV